MTLQSIFEEAHKAEKIREKQRAAFIDSIVDSVIKHIKAYLMDEVGSKNWVFIQRDRLSVTEMQHISKALAKELGVLIDVRKGSSIVYVATNTGNQGYSIVISHSRLDALYRAYKENL